MDENILDEKLVDSWNEAGRIFHDSPTVTNYMNLRKVDRLCNATVLQAKIDKVEIVDNRIDVDISNYPNIERRHNSESETDLKAFLFNHSEDFESDYVSQNEDGFGL